MVRVEDVPDGLFQGGSYRETPPEDILDFLTANRGKQEQYSAQTKKEEEE